ncbi:hypothetical protein EC968_002422 [Mortierella alpina]|nr:hypothetical protein EC968_002422 [Mortierella alpina]
MPPQAIRSSESGENALSSGRDPSEVPVSLKTSTRTATQANPNSEFNEYALSSELHLPDKPIFFRRHIMLLVEYLLYPHSIPGDNMLDRAYSIGIIPAWMQAMTLLAPLTKIHSLFERLPGLRRPRLMISTTNSTIELRGYEKALDQLCDHNSREAEYFDYSVAVMLLVMSAGTYDRRLSPPKRLSSPDDAALCSKFENLYLGAPKAHPGASAELFTNDDATVLVLGGTATAYDECLAGATFFRDNHNGNYREFLAGQVHKGFYDSLFGVLNTAEPAQIPFVLPKHWGLIGGPLTPMKCIMENILTLAIQSRLEQKNPQPVNLWITGHSTGGALASLAMAYLQSVVWEHNSLLDGWNASDQNIPGAGSTVLEVMTAQFYKGFSSFQACKECPSCLKKKLRSCSDCYDCKQSRLNMIQKLHEGCERCKEHISNKLEALRRGCSDCTRDELVQNDGEGLQRCRACDYCDECGKCDDCKARMGCSDYKKHKELVVLRDCYTFGSPRVGDAAFAKAFAEDQWDLRKVSPYKPAYWRIVNQGDIDPGCRSSLLDYQHVGHLVEIFPSSKKRNPSKRKPIVSQSQFEDAIEKEAIKAGQQKEPKKDLSKLVLREQVLRGPALREQALWEPALRDQALMEEFLRENESSTTNTDPEDITITKPSDFITMKLKSLLRMAQQGLFESTSRRIRSIPVAFTHSPNSYKNSLSRARERFRSFPAEWMED